MEDFLIELKNVNKQYGGKVILNDVSLNVRSNEFISIMGPSGCGKSTLLNILGLLDSFEGEYYINSKKIFRRNYSRIRNKYIGFVFQMYYLLPNMNVKDNILLPLMYSDKKTIRRALKQFDEIVLDLDIGDLLYQKSDVLSGGEKQRVAIARSMILEPYILIADEPTGALDQKNSMDVMECFKKYVSKGHSVVMVTHNVQIGNIADRKYVLRKGKLNEIQ